MKIMKTVLCVGVLGLSALGYADTNSKKCKDIWSEVETYRANKDVRSASIHAESYVDKRCLENKDAEKNSIISNIRAENLVLEKEEFLEDFTDPSIEESRKKDKNFLPGNKKYAHLIPVCFFKDYYQGVVDTMKSLNDFNVGVLFDGLTKIEADAYKARLVPVEAFFKGLVGEIQKDMTNQCMLPLNDLLDTFDPEHPTNMSTIPPELVATKDKIAELAARVSASEKLRNNEQLRGIQKLIPDTTELKQRARERCVKLGLTNLSSPTKPDGECASMLFQFLNADAEEVNDNAIKVINL